MSLFSSPMLLGFDEMERLIDRVGNGGDGYPPYNIERIGANDAANGDTEPVERLRITLAVAGFRRDQLDITLEENQLVIRGRQEDDKSVSTSTAASPRASSAGHSCWPRVSR
jgi:HSP20 family molecular chaperone IbpA